MVVEKVILVFYLNTFSRKRFAFLHETYKRIEIYFFLPLHNFHHYFLLLL